MRVRGIVAVLAFAVALPGGIARASLPLETVVAFDPGSGEFPEGVAVDKTDNVYVSLIQPVGEIRKVDPSGTQSVFADFDVPGFGPLGLAVDAPGNVFVAVASFDVSTQGVYRVRPDGASERLPGTSGILFPNGVALDKRGNVYATDSIRGAVWRIPPGGSAEIWIQDPLLEGTGAAGLGVPIGANGIAFFRNEIIVANTERSRIVDIPVEPDGGAGTLRVLAEGPALFGADGIALGVSGNVYAVVNPQSTLVRIAGDGSIAMLATAADGLDNPASLAFGTGKGDRQSLFVVNFAIFSASPAPALLKVAVGEPGLPLP
jgi:sugar lactone lactonase YvrE